MTSEHYVAVGMFETWAPKLFQYYDSCMKAVTEHLGASAATVSNYLPLASVTVNFGPQAICRTHRDLNNLGWGWCFILLLGKWDPRRGGHIVLHDMKLILEVCAGDVVAIPSASIAHATIPVGKSETRYAVTWYTGMGLFQSVAAGMMSLKKYKGSEGREGEPDGLSAEERWRNGCGMFSTLAELQERFQ